MKKRKPLTDADGEVRELTAEDFRAMKRLDQFPELAKLVRGRGERGVQKRPTKQQVTLRLDRDVLDRFRATGDGWQSRINDALRKARVG
ncbi:MAG TPA: BrnA antitoxin family protein [Micropepsaceae bacterium]|jgi:uncharacterized protein (DUF4415 family)|nr:BrnA antitoxin family protein [Micropepsaceae bacterium]